MALVHFYTQGKADDRPVQRRAVKQRSRDRANENQVLAAFLARLFETFLPGCQKNRGVSKTRGRGLSFFFLFFKECCFKVRGFFKKRQTLTSGPTVILTLRVTGTQKTVSQILKHSSYKNNLALEHLWLIFVCFFLFYYTFALLSFLITFYGNNFLITFFFYHSLASQIFDVFNSFVWFLLFLISF